MQPERIDELMKDLDSKVASAPEESGVAMGEMIFAECKRRGLLSMETFSWLGSDFWPQALPAYKGKFAFVNHELPDWEFQMGKAA